MALRLQIVTKSLRVFLILSVFESIFLRHKQKDLQWLCGFWRPTFDAVVNAKSLGFSSSKPMHYRNGLIFRKIGVLCGRYHLPGCIFISGFVSVVVSFFFFDFCSRSHPGDTTEGAAVAIRTKRVCPQTIGGLTH